MLEKLHSGVIRSAVGIGFCTNKYPVGGLGTETHTDKVTCSPVDGNAVTGGSQETDAASLPQQHLVFTTAVFTMTV